MEAPKALFVVHDGSQCAFEKRRCAGFTTTGLVMSTFVVEDCFMLSFESDVISKRESSTNSMKDRERQVAFLLRLAQSDHYFVRCFNHLQTVEAMRATSYHSMLFHLLLWSSAIRAVEGFVSHGKSRRTCGALGCRCDLARVVPSVGRLSASNDAENSGDEPPIGEEPPQLNVASAASTKEEQPYPIDVPSPILLSASMVLAIASTGEGEMPYAYSNLSKEKSGFQKRSPELDLDLDMYL
jgi:hypothetical protein